MLHPQPLASASADVGGTFTDVVVVDRTTGVVHVAKAPTVADDPARGIIDAIAKTQVPPSAMDRFVHGTTIGINTLLQRHGAKVGFLTTRGFKDLLLIGRGNWPSFRLTWDRPTPLVPGRLAVEVNERVKADGTVIDALDEAEVIAKARELVESGAEAIAVCFINAYAMPQHERRAGEIIREHFPDIVVCLSHDLSRRYREYDRAVTATGEAYLRPRMRTYFDKLSNGMAEGGFAGRLFITASDGGVMSVEQARDRALRTLVSGCASGVAGAAVVASASGWNDVLAIDMGGTSFDAAIIQHGHPSISPTAVVAGFEFQVPIISLSTIGAGGGSIAYLDSAGGLHVGPESAGARPGPACYGHGGTRPTFTDAALVAGLIPEQILEGEMTLDREKAIEVISREIAEPLGLSVSEAASGIIGIVEARMAMLLEEMTVGNGLDPRDFTLFAYGGGGPLVAARLAEELGIRRIVIPQHPGVFSAWGMQTLDVVQEASVTKLIVPSTASGAELSAPFEELIAETSAQLRREGFGPDDITMLRFVEMRYESQEHTLLIPYDDRGADAMHTAFDTAHAARFGFTVPGGVEIVTYRVRAIGKLEKPAFADAPAAEPFDGPARSRQVDHRAVGAARPWNVLDRRHISTETPVQGPALVEEPTATTVVPEGWNARIDEGKLVLER